MARGKRPHAKNLEEDVKVSSKEIIEDKDTTIGEEEEGQDEQSDNDSSDSSVYSDLEEGKVYNLLKCFALKIRENVFYKVCQALRVIFR